MGFPGEELVGAALEKFGDGVIQKMTEAEAKRDREFSYKLKELEFYKSNYDKEIKSIFDSWFGLLMNLQVATNNAASEEIKKKHQKKVDDILAIDKFINLKISTMKYCGSETGKALALYNRLLQSCYKEEKPKFSDVYMICLLLAKMKEEILGQKLDPLCLIQLLVSDYDVNLDKINESRSYVEEKWKEFFPEAE